MSGKKVTHKHSKKLALGLRHAISNLEATESAIEVELESLGADNDWVGPLEQSGSTLLEEAFRTLQNGSDKEKDELQQRYREQPPMWDEDSEQLRSLLLNLYLEMVKDIRKAIENGRLIEAVDLSTSMMQDPELLRAEVFRLGNAGALISYGEKAQKSQFKAARSRRHCRGIYASLKNVMTKYHNAGERQPPPGDLVWEVSGDGIEGADGRTYEVYRDGKEICQRLQPVYSYNGTERQVLRSGGMERCIGLHGFTKYVTEIRKELKGSQD